MSRFDQRDPGTDPDYCEGLEPDDDTPALEERAADSNDGMLTQELFDAFVNSDLLLDVE